jgi:dsDNA-specific endonuclease/ATPase MutS2
VHGRGTGAVRAAVREELKTHPLVESSKTDSQDGATLVQLGSSA